MDCSSANEKMRGVVTWKWLIALLQQVFNYEKGARKKYNPVINSIVATRPRRSLRFFITRSWSYRTDRRLISAYVVEFLAGFFFLRTEEVHISYEAISV